MTEAPSFLVAAVRRFLQPESDLPDSANLNWTELLRLGSAHAVTPMLYSALRDARVPMDIAADLRCSFAGCVQQSLAQSAELASIASVFEENAIPMIAVKGPLLSHYLYGKLGARSSGDIDLLVKDTDVVRIRHVLTSSGYRVLNTFHWESDSAYLRSREKEMSFEGVSGVGIDIHWRLLPQYFPSPLDDLNVWETSRTVPLAGRQVLTLAPENVFLLLCSHTAKHAFERLGWICDIAQFLMVTPDLDWPAVLAQAGRTRTMRQVLVSLRLAGRLLEAPLPPGLPEDFAADELARFFANRVLTGVVPPTPHLELSRYCLALLEGSGHRFRFRWGHYFTPTEAEFAALRLPPWLYFLYYPFRPARLIAKYVVPRRA